MKDGNNQSTFLPRTRAFVHPSSLLAPGVKSRAIWTMTTGARLPAARI
jgi:hypothetical protein